MKRHTFHIDDSTDKAQALLEFLRTLDFVFEEGKEYTLTNEHLEILEERIIELTVVLTPILGMN